MEKLYEDHYPGFDHPATALSKFHTAGDIFTILLTDRSIIHHTPTDTESFKQWLLKNGVSDIKVNANR